MHAPPLIDRLIRRVSLHTPNHFVANVALLGLNFCVKNKRLPAPLSAERASLSDYIFWRSVGPWSAFERACVDKETAKPIARQLSPQVGIAETMEVFRMEGLSFDDFKARLLIYRGGHAVAKATHGSGATLFLDEDVPEPALRHFYRKCQASYFPLFREGQYDKLEKKVLIERSLGNPEAGRKSVDELKFFCSRGQPFLCQINFDRFGDHRLINMSVPDFTDFGVSYSTGRPNAVPARPARWERFLDIAASLSKPFEFVRIDLYDGEDDIYFGEFTFTPGAGMVPYSDPKFDRWLLAQLQSAEPLPQSDLTWAR